MELSSIKLVILDIDGVVIKGRTPILGAIEGIRLLKENNVKVVYLTNNSTRPRKRIAELLVSIGIEVSISDIFTSSYLTALYLDKEANKGDRIFIIGEEGIVLELEEMGFQNLFWSNYEPPIDYVIVGMDKHFNFQKLTYAQQAIFSGAKFIATNTDPTFPIENGLIPGGGSIVKAVEVAAKKQPIIIGKPEIVGLRLILSKFNILEPKEVLLIGDRIETDLVAGKKLGCKTGIVLSGVTTKNELEGLEDAIKPDYYGENLLELLGGENYDDRI
ncbi:MAG: HAD-IIA family hydrolase [bacterium]|nr:HAD-IIA family hydrolase [bacterium]